MTRASYDLVPLGETDFNGASVPLPDGALATFEIPGHDPILKIRGFGGTLRTIHLKTSDKAKGDPIICSITNTCGEQETAGVKDKEYAAFYDLLQSPPDLLERVVPRRVLLYANGKRGGGGGRCYKQAKASLI